MPLLPDERAALRRYFVMALCSLQRMDLYWWPAKRRILARSPVAVKKHRLPETAALIGAYAHPFNADDFLGDLEALIERQRGQASVCS